MKKLRRRLARASRRRWIRWPLRLLVVCGLLLVAVIATRVVGTVQDRRAGRIAGNEVAALHAGGWLAEIEDLEKLAFETYGSRDPALDRLLEATEGADVPIYDEDPAAPAGSPAVGGGGGVGITTTRRRTRDVPARRPRLRASVSTRQAGSGCSATGSFGRRRTRPPPAARRRRSSGSSSSAGCSTTDFERRGSGI